MSVLKILIVGNFTDKPKREWYLGDQYALMHGLIKLGHCVINFGDRQYAHHYWYRSRKKTNQHFLQLVRDFKPNVIFFIHADKITLETCLSIKEFLPQCKLIQWNVDALWLDHNRQRILKYHQAMDTSFVTTAGTLLEDLQKQSPHIAFVPNMVDENIHYHHNDKKTSMDALYDIIFTIGAGHDQRNFTDFEGNGDAFATLLYEKLPQHIRKYFAGSHYHPNMIGSAYDNILSQSIMGINISRYGHYYLYSSNRLAHLMGNGLLAFVDSNNGLQDLFNDNEMIFVSSQHELCDKIVFYAKHDVQRQKIAHLGKKAYHKYYNSKIIADYMLKTTYDIYDTDINYWLGIRQH